MATWPVRTKADRVECTEQFRLVFRVTDDTAQLVEAVRNLTLVTVLARHVLLVQPAQLRLVARAGIEGRLAGATVSFSVPVAALQHN